MQNKILSNSNFVQFYYIASTDDYTILPPYFVKLLVYYTSSRVAKLLSQSVQLATELMQMYQIELNIAKWTDLSLNPIDSAPYNKYDRGGIGGGLWG